MRIAAKNVSRTGDALLRLLADGPRTGLAGEPVDDAVVERAIQHRVGGAVAWAAEQIDAPIPPRLREVCVRTTVGRLATVGDLCRFEAAMAASSIEFLAFKGLVLSTVAYRDQYDRPAADLDVLIHPSDVMRALTALERMGALHLDRNWQLMLDRMIGELHFLLPGGTSLDLHWHLLVNEVLRKRFRPDHDALFRTSRQVEIDGVSVRTFGPAETLVYSCLHACVSGGHRLVWLKDLERLVINDDVDWFDVVRVARSWGCHLQVAMMLQRTSASLGLKIDQRVLRALAGSRWLPACFRFVDRRFPVADIVADEGFLRLVTRSIADTVPHSFVRFVGRVTSFGRRRLTHGDFDDPLELMVDRPGLGARERYLGLLEGWSGRG